MLKSADRARLCEFYPGICLRTEEKARKNLSQVKKNLRVQYAYYQNTHTLKTLTNTHITKPTYTHTHTLQNNIKPPQYKLKQNAYRKSKTMGRKKSTYFLTLLIHRYRTAFLTGPLHHLTAIHVTSLHSPTINTLHGTPRFTPFCMLDNQGYRHTIRICNTSYFCTAINSSTNAPQCYVYKYTACLVL
jgi:hypothetical protein